jgi:agmatinase
VVGADIVEVSPAYDHAEITGIAAANIGYELLSVLAPSGRGMEDEA